MTDFAERYRQLRDQGRSPEQAYREAQQGDTEDLVSAVAKPVTRFGVTEPGVTMGRAEPATPAESEATRVNLAKGRPRNLSERVGGLLNQVAAGSAEGLPWIPAVPVLGAVNLYSAAREALPVGRLPNETPDEGYLSRVKRRIEGNPLGKAVHGALNAASRKASDVFGEPTTGAEKVARFAGNAVTPTAIAGKAARGGKALMRTADDVAPIVKPAEMATEAIGGADGALERVRAIRKTMGMSGKGELPILAGTAGGIGGGAVGATQGDTPAERIRNALIFGAMGAWAGVKGGRAAEQMNERGSVGVPRTPEQALTKYQKLDDAALLDRLVELEVRAQDAALTVGRETAPWTRNIREAWNADFPSVSGVSWTNKGGRAQGALQRDGKLADEVRSVLQARGLTDDAINQTVYERMMGDAAEPDLIRTEAGPGLERDVPLPPEPPGSGPPAPPKPPKPVASAPDEPPPPPPPPPPETDLKAAAAREYVNTPRFAELTSEGRKLLDDAVLQTAARANRIPKERVPWDQVKAEGAELLRTNPERLYTLKPTEVGGKEAYAISTLVQGKINQLAEINAGLLKATDHAEIGNLTKQAAALESESSQLLDKLMKGTSQQGRDLNANKILAGLTNDPVTWLLKATRAADRPLTDMERSTILGHLNRGERAEMLRFVGHLQPQNIRQKGVTIWKAGLLTNPSTHAANISGNTTLAMAEELAKQPAAAADWLMGLATKVRTKRHTSLRQMGAQTKGAIEGAKDIPDILKGLPVGDNVTFGLIPRETKMGNAITTAFVNGPFRLLNAEDRVFGAAAYRGSLAEQAELLARTEGVKGAARKQRIIDLIENPTDEMAIRAAEDALVRTFRDKTPVGEALAGVQRNLGTAGQVIIPFTRTPAAVGTRLGEYTPYGLVKGSLQGTRAVLKIRKAIKAAEPTTPELKRLQQVAAETLGRGITGTGLMAAGYYLYQAGAYTGVRPTRDKGLSDTKEAAGIPSDAFRIGKGFIEPNRIGIPAMLMILGAAIGEARDAGEDESPGAGIGQAFASFIRILTDQPFLRGTTDLQRIREDPIEAGSTYVRNLAGSAVPAGVAAAARATDPTMRETRSLGDVLKSRIPGLSDNLPARRNFLGDEQPRQAPGVLNNMVTPFRLSRDRLDDPLLNAVVASGATITKLQKRAGEGGEAYSARSQAVGARLKGTLGELVHTPGFDRLPVDQQGSVVERVTSSVRGQSTKQEQALRYQAYRDQGLSAEEAYQRVRGEFQRGRNAGQVGALLAPR